MKNPSLLAASFTLALLVMSAAPGAAGPGADASPAPAMDDSDDLPPPGEAFRLAVMAYLGARKAKARPEFYAFNDAAAPKPWELKFLRVREASRQLVGDSRQCAVVEFATAAGGSVDVAFEAAAVKDVWRVSSAAVQKADGKERFRLGPSCRRVPVK